LSDAGLGTALTLRPEGSAEVRNVIGGLPLDGGWSGIASVSVAPGHLQITDNTGSLLTLPFDQTFLE
jgi:hypothetical protein